MKSFFGGCGMRDRHDCRESSSVPRPLYGANSCNHIKIIIILGKTK